MRADSSTLGDDAGALPRAASIGAGINVLRTVVVAGGIGTSILFVAIGLRAELQLYADGSIFSYAVAVQDAWAFHWHNISGRLSVYLLSSLPAEIYVRLTGDPRGGVAIYGFLFFVAPLLGLIATFVADRSQGRILFGASCWSTACLCPLVFGFPTEMWVAHALFWPALAICHYARSGPGAIVMVAAVLLALVFTHPGAVIFACAILATLWLRGRGIPRFCGRRLPLFRYWRSGSSSKRSAARMSIVRAPSPEPL